MEKWQAAESAVAKARQWVKRLWEEDEEQKCWGHAVFVEPEVDSGKEMDEYLSWRDAVLFWGKIAISCGKTLSAKRQLQRLDWPTTDDAAGRDKEKGENQKPADKSQRMR